MEILPLLNAINSVFDIFGIRDLTKSNNLLDSIYLNSK